MADAAALLQQLGFSDYEARAYAALLQRNPLNGYELAKVSGVPRPNIYAILQKLEERAAVTRLETPDGTRYVPVRPQELIQRIGSRFQQTLDAAEKELAGLSAPTENVYVSNMHDYALLLDHARAVLDAARARILVAITPLEAASLAAPLADATARGVTVTTLCLTACANECGNCCGQIYRYHVAPMSQVRWFILVADEDELIAGAIGDTEDVQAIRTQQRLLVAMASGYIRRSIALVALLGDLSKRLDGVLQPETRAILQNIGLDEIDADWSTYMRTLLGGEMP
jgi:DNA-binding MarR family transcriptional regulator